MLEPKKLSGNITINSDGDFIRIFTDKKGREVKREGIYSPISQNERHIRILKEILLKEDLIRTIIYRSLVVMADPKTIINKDKCPAAIKKSLYRHDQIVNFLEKVQKELDEEKYLLEKYMWNVANYLKDHHVPAVPDYMSKYSLAEEDFMDSGFLNIQPIQPEPVTPPPAEETPIDPEILTKKLKEFRLNTSRKEDVKPYFIFDNKQMDELVTKRPRSKEELLAVYGFGPRK